MLHPTQHVLCVTVRLVAFRVASIILFTFSYAALNGVATFDTFCVPVFLVSSLLP